MSIDVLQEKIRAMKSPIMVGLDPTPDIIPLHILRDCYGTYGETPEGMAQAYRQFCYELLDALKELAPAVKLQTVCFETLGAPGIAAMQDVSKKAHELGYYVMFDALRSDAPHIAELYARSFFGAVRIGQKEFSPYYADSITLNGYLGTESVRPYLPYCKDSGKSIFMMVRSSNRTGREVQDLLTGGRSVHLAMLDLCMRWSQDLYGKYGFSEVGAVVGAYDSKTIAQLREKYSRLFFLVVGYGAQGGTAKPVSAAFDRMGHGAVVAASRSIIGAWKLCDSDGADYVDYAKDAVYKMKKDITGYVIIL